MTTENMIIVGDKFECFAENEGVLTASEALHILKHQLLSDKKIRFKLGQGLSEAQVSQLVKTAQDAGLSNLLEFNETVKSGRNYVHKHQQRNSMLGLPRRICEKKFELDVMLDDACDEMGDHVTGHHVQGMVITEAARQAFLTITEAFFLKDNDFSSYFVINTLNSQYTSFMFPVPATIEYEIVEHKEKKAGAHSFDVVMNVVQNGVICSVVTTSFSTYNAEWLEKKEAAMACDAIKYVLNNEGEQNVAA
ncbi:AfsA-related hotdog domain-containing protein [Thalassomonas sp. RHCl1]|uniref:AfsA-related hotdog domain-containing protein n=1 Tax=Thalassomonas sp. RHCl1 TaxID=2995320 RepID=UPI00248CA913|nr:AfsA-related hotdog domain-containing protein [Thalassomonas sp. RHCl1]